MGYACRGIRVGRKNRSRSYSRVKKDIKNQILQEYELNKNAAYINVNLESIVIICNWIDSIIGAKAMYSEILQ